MYYDLGSYPGFVTESDLIYIPHYFEAQTGKPLEQPELHDGQMTVAIFDIGRGPRVVAMDNLTDMAALWAALGLRRGSFALEWYVGRVKLKLREAVKIRLSDLLSS